MITPQQIDQVAFKKSSFGGYNMQQVDEFLEPLTEDYVTLYKENALLKSKLRVLAGKLEEYRKGEGAAKAPAAAPADSQAAAQALQNAQAQAAQRVQTAQAQATQTVKNAQAQAAQILADAKAQSDKLLKEAAAKAQAAAAAPVTAPVPSSNAEALIAAENARDPGADARLHPGPGADQGCNPRSPCGSRCSCSPQGCAQARQLRSSRCTRSPSLLHSPRSSQGACQFHCPGCPCSTYSTESSCSSGCSRCPHRVRPELRQRLRSRRDCP